MHILTAVKAVTMRNVFILAADRKSFPCKNSKHTIAARCHEKILNEKKKKELRKVLQ